MNTLINSIATNGELAGCSPDMLVLLDIFVFGFVCVIVVCMMIALASMSKGVR